MPLLPLANVSLQSLQVERGFDLIGLRCFPFTPLLTMLLKSGKRFEHLAGPLGRLEIPSGQVRFGVGQVTLRIRSRVCDSDSACLSA